MQLVPVRIANPPSRGDVAAPPEVEQTLRRSCYDCHSNQTQWPWYTRIAPLSWLVAHDVNAGRRQINFSQWSDYFPATRARKLKWMDRALRGEAMPPWPYRAMHPSSRLGPADRDRLQRWIAAELAADESGR